MLVQVKVNAPRDFRLQINDIRYQEETAPYLGYTLDQCPQWDVQTNALVPKQMLFSLA